MTDHLITHSASQHTDPDNVIHCHGAGSLDGFFAPAPTSILDTLTARYKTMRASLESVAAMVNSNDNAAAIAHFIHGNRPQRGNHMPAVGQLFQLSGALASLHAECWQEALSLTDVYEYMPNERRSEWDNMIHEMTTPEFNEDTVRATLNDLLLQRETFLAERVDGIFRALSGAHVTNRPEGFSRRMIMNGMFDQWDTLDYSRKGYIHDLRHVIAKFMGRGVPVGTDNALKAAYARSGEWLSLDGGTLRVRAYKKGTVHCEIHPEMAWRLNSILAHLYPLAIPSQHREKPARRMKTFELKGNLLPFPVLSELDSMSAERHLPAQRGRFTQPMQPVTTNPFNRRFHQGEHDKRARAEAVRVLETIGGVKQGDNSRAWWEFDYDPTEALSEIVASGCLPDIKSHQYYPTRAVLAEMLIESADIQDTDLCLEPSAGMGGIADFMPKEQTTCVEISPLHCHVLKAKGYACFQADFLAWAETTVPCFDVVAMNPPYSEGRAIAHVRAAAKLLCHGGRLVAILPAGTDKDALLPGWHCEWSGVHEGAFDGTGVRVIMLKAVKPS